VHLLLRKSQLRLPPYTAHFNFLGDEFTANTVKVHKCALQNFKTELINFARQAYRLQKQLWFASSGLSYALLRNNSQSRIKLRQLAELNLPK
jgi:hypothetical protein